MIKKYLTLSIFCTAAFLIIYFSLSLHARTNGSGIIRNTNAPNEGTCVGCHSGTALQTSSTATSNLIHSPNFIGNGYIPDSTYDMTIAFKKTGTIKFGFSLTVLDEANDESVGTLTSVIGSTQAQNGSVSGKTRTYISHTNASVDSTSKDSIYWSFKWKAPASNKGKIRFYTVLNATNRNNSTSGDVIYAKEFSYDLSDSITRARITNNDTAVCVGESVSLAGTGTSNPTSYLWTSAGGTFSNDTTANTSINFSTPGPKIVLLKTSNQYGEGLTDTMNITVIAKPIAEILASDTLFLCEGDSTLLQARSQFNSTYKWAPSNTFGNSLWVKDSGAYQVTVTNSSGCQKISNSIHVIIKPKPTTSIVALNSNDTVCNLFPQKFVHSSNLVLDSFHIYKNGQYFGTSTADTFEVTPNSSDSMSIEVIGFSGNCSSELSNSITKYTLPTPNAPAPSCGIIRDNSIEISWNAVPNVLGYEVSIDSGASWIPIPSTQTTFTENGLLKGLTKRYEIRSVSSTECPKSSIAQVTCNTSPCETPYSNILFDTLICANDTLESVYQNLTSNAYTITVNGLPQGSDSIIKIILNRDSTLLFSLLDNEQVGCAAFEESIDVKVEENINASYGILSGIEFCKGTELPLEIDPKRVELNYELYLNSLLNKIDSNKGSGLFRPVISLDSQNYIIQVSGTVCKETINLPKIIGNDLPIFSISNNADWYYHTLKTIGDQDNTYEWIDSSGTFAAQTGDSLVYFFRNQKGSRQKFYVTATNAKGCETRDSISFRVGDFLSTSKIDTKLSVYPNPSKGVINIEYSGLQEQVIKVYSAQGRLITSINLKKGINIFDLSPYGKGLYILSHENNTWQKSLLILE